MTEKLPPKDYPYDIPCDVEPDEETEEEDLSLEDALTSLQPCVAELHESN